jgi:hypothetical protein
MDLHPIRATTAIRHLTIIYTGAKKKGLAQEAAAIYEPRFAGFFRVFIGGQHMPTRARMSLFFNSLLELSELRLSELRRTAKPLLQ